MQIKCKQCLAKYKLPDEKIRASGTKVRCPKCQNTFFVYPDNAPPPPEIAPPKPQTPQDLERPFAPKKSTAPQTESTPKDRFAEFDQIKDEAPSSFESEKTVVSKVMASPFKAKEPLFEVPPPPVPSIAPREDDADFFVSGEEAKAESSPNFDDETDAPENSEEVRRPFGDATFAEIQNMPGIQKKKRMPLIQILGSLGILLAAVLYFITDRQPGPNSQTAQHTETEPEIKISRPSTWYKDDVLVIQDYLNQQAVLPIQEQQQPQRRAAVAEALIINGFLTGSAEQLASGVGYASALLASHPGSILGLMGLNTYALYRLDFSTLESLSKQWPNNQRELVEFKLTQALLYAKAGDPNEALKSAAELAQLVPDWPRLWAVSLLIATDHLAVADSILGAGYVAETVKRWEKYYNYLKKQGELTPDLFRELEKKLKRRNLVTADVSPKKAIPPPPAAAIQPTQAQPIEVPPAPKPADITPPINQAIPPIAEKKAEKKEPIKIVTAPKAPKTLPKADQNLIALNKKAKQSRQKASELYQQANERLKQNRVDDAIDLYQRSLREDPDLAESYKQLGVIFMERQQKDRALRNLKIYLQLRPTGDDKQLVEGWISSMQ